MPHQTTATTTTSTLGFAQTPAAVRPLIVLPGPSYVDTFTLHTSDAATWSAEQWAGSMFEEAAGFGGQLLWRLLLGLRLSNSRAPDDVAGWAVITRSATVVRLEARAWHMTAHLTVQVDDDQVTLVTVVRYDHWFARLLWTPSSAAHRRLAPGLLEETHAHLRWPHGRQCLNSIPTVPAHQGGRHGRPAGGRPG